MEPSFNSAKEKSLSLFRRFRSFVVDNKRLQRFTCDLVLHVIIGTLLDCLAELHGIPKPLAIAVTVAVCRILKSVVADHSE